MCFESTGSACHGDSGGGMFLQEKNRLVTVQYIMTYCTFQQAIVCKIKKHI
jgi:hypothetical protein